MNIAFIGLGHMGLGIATNLAKASHTVRGHDLSPDALARAAQQGVHPCTSLDDALTNSTCIATCLLGSVNQRVLRDEIMPRITPGQIIIDHSTFAAPDARQLAADFAARDVTYLDAPISGGEQGAARGSLSVFVGGPRETFDQLTDYFQPIADPRYLFHCGPAGMGQTAKAIQNMESWVAGAQRMEILAFGLKRGFTPEQMLAFCRDSPAMKQSVDWLTAENLDRMNALIAEWPYFLAEASRTGDLPMLQAAWDRAASHGQPFTDFLGRKSYSFWQALMADSASDS